MLFAVLLMVVFCLGWGCIGGLWEAFVLVGFCVLCGILVGFLGFWFGLVACLSGCLFGCVFGVRWGVLCGVDCLVVVLCGVFVFVFVLVSGGLLYCGLGLCCWGFFVFVVLGGFG